MSVNTPSAEAAQRASTASFLTSFTVNAAIAGGELVAWVFLRRYIKALYEPRTYIPPREKQAKVLGTNLFLPIWRIIRADPAEILEKNGVDPYVFVRFLIMMSKAMIPIWLVSWAVLLPVNSVKTGTANKTGLDRFTFGNIAREDHHRLWAHLILDYLFIGWIVYLMWGEMKHWLVIRQKYLISPGHSKTPQANTVLITGIGKGYMDEHKLARLFAHLPGGVKRIWLVRNLKEMPDLWERRKKATAALESAQVKLIKLARQHKVETDAKIDKLQKKNKPIPESLKKPVNAQLLEVHGNKDNREKQLGLADQLVPRGKRPTKRLKPKWAPFSLGFLGIGQKVDTIEWAQKEIQEVQPKLQAARDQLRRDTEHEGIGGETYPPLNSAFIHFNQQIAAHMAAQCLTHNQPYRMDRRYIEQSPKNVIWRNLSMSAYEQNVRRAISYAISVGLIVAWTFPVAFIGLLSSISSLIDAYSWLQWLSFLEGESQGIKILQGLISGVLPPILLALLNLVLPIILRQVIALEGVPSKTGVELNLMTRYFIFLVIHTFFIVTLTSGLIKAIPELIENPLSIPNILANQMPGASTFFITLVLTQFTGTAGTLLQPISLAFYYIRVVLGGGTPRSVFKSRYHLNDTLWGAQFPRVTVYAVIMLGYCVISPIISGFGALYFVLSAMAWKYLFIWVQVQPSARDTGGAFFPKAITHVFVGIYIQEVCLCALFFLARDADLKVAAIPQAALMIVLIVATAAAHYVLVVSYKPLIHSLPLSLAHLSYGMAKEPGHEGSVIGEYTEDHEMNSSREHLTKPPGASLPSSPSPNESDETIQEAAFPKEKQPQSGDQAQPGSVIAETEGAPTQRDFAFPSNGIEDVQYPPSSRSPTGHTDARPTAAGPPVGEPHGEALEMGTIGAEPDPVNEDRSDPYFAVPGGPGVLQEDDIDENDPNAFFHPATKEPMRVLWLPKDELGLCDAEIEANKAIGVDAVHRYATLNAKGRIQVTGPPPDHY